MKLAISALEIFLILLVVLSLATGFVESIMTPRISFPLVTKRFSSTKYDTTRKPNRLPIKSYAKVPATKVVTDIDDTVKSSGGVKLFGIPLGGIDVRLKNVNDPARTSLIDLHFFNILNKDTISPWRILPGSISVRIRVVVKY